ncbi:aliphatic sulfonate ABC transporter substrate-binding protein [Solibacillus sp. FSL W7-1472]|uniref:aliphatic sulfonate ABC transporter substrate-binding protein n=1 Tax=Solibacillus sp. FSL W7-1472 TaxID=2921707 RepID=UPI0007FB5455|nr:aliphatic sulfonate ABC transporter substrate-binding protein [Solibacillus silvestris]OBW55876.1 sulfonate ABC transporter substrate-binding protein [Solibacillus silvestris]
MRKQLYTFLLLALTFLLAACASEETKSSKASSNSNDLVVRIGIQGSGGLFGKAKEDRLFEEAFESHGAKVEWVEFQSGPPMTEAIASNKLDIAGLGNMPVITAQAANIPFKIISQTLEGKKNVGVIVQSSSGITTLEELKGKKIAVGKGTNAYDFILRSFDKLNINPDEVELINLNPDEAQAAFDSGGVDAWAIWEPYLTINTLSEKGTIIADGESVGLLSPSYTIARSKFTEEHPELVVTYLKTLNELLAWETANETEAVERYAKERNLPVALMEQTRQRSKSINILVEDAIIQEHQKTADFQYKQGTIRQKIDVSEVFDNRFYKEAVK